MNRSQVTLVFWLALGALASSGYAMVEQYRTHVVLANSEDDCNYFDRAGWALKAVVREGNHVRCEYR